MILPEPKKGMTKVSDSDPTVLVLMHNESKALERMCFNMQHMS